MATRQPDVHRWQDPAGRPAPPAAFEQGDGRAPTSALSVRWPGAKGFHISRYRFSRGAHISAVPADHLIVVQPKAVSRMKCRVGDARLDHSPPAWNVTICPAGLPCEAETDDDVDIVMLSLPVETMAFAASETSRQAIELGGRLDERDDGLARLIQLTLHHASDGTGLGALWWDQATDILVDRLLTRYSRTTLDAAQQGLARWQLARIRDFVFENVGEPLTVEMLAAVIGQSRSHFTRMFVRTTGLTPHQYVMRVRLKVAHDLLKRGRCGPAAAAAAAGFADQSHLAGWTRRMFGATVGQMHPRS